MNPLSQNAAAADPMSFKLGTWLVRWHQDTQQWQAISERRACEPVEGAHEILTAMLHYAQARRAVQGQS
jgi:hypothetical protein